MLCCFLLPVAACFHVVTRVSLHVLLLQVPHVQVQPYVFEVWMPVPLVRRNGPRGCVPNVWVRQLRLQASVRVLWVRVRPVRQQGPRRSMPHRRVCVVFLLAVVGALGPHRAKEACRRESSCESNGAGRSNRANRRRRICGSGRRRRHMTAVSEHNVTIFGLFLQPKTQTTGQRNQ